MTHSLHSGFCKKPNQCFFLNPGTSPESLEMSSNVLVSTTSTNLLSRVHLHDAIAMTPDWMNHSSNPPVIFMMSWRQLEQKSWKIYVSVQKKKKKRKQSFFFFERLFDVFLNGIRSYFGAFPHHRMVSRHLTLMFIWLHQSWFVKSGRILGRKKKWRKPRT